MLLKQTSLNKLSPAHSSPTFHLAAKEDKYQYDAHEQNHAFAYQQYLANQPIEAAPEQQCVIETPKHNLKWYQDFLRHVVNKHHLGICQCSVCQTNQLKRQHSTQISQSVSSTSGSSSSSSSSSQGDQKSTTNQFTTAQWN